VSVDVLAIGAHPDDVEVGIGGLVHKLTARGCTVGILDLTEGELASRGSVEERREEARLAADVLGVTRRENAQLPDGRVANTTEQQGRLIPLLRRFRPRMILAPMAGDYHPDHDAAHALVRAANHFAGMSRIETDAPPHRVKRLYFYRVYLDAGDPSAVVDISGHFEAKLEALRAYGSQFHNPDYEGAETGVSSQVFWDGIRVKAEYWGARVGTRYGEALFADGPVAVDLPQGLEEVP
jgi:N-acetylglucosamine malate deacetylase 1